MKNFFCFLVWLLLLAYSKAAGQRLRVGDSLPVVSVTNVMNYEQDRFSLSAFRGKVIILDFWQTSCRMCIASFKKLDSLQRQFNDFVQILLVNNESPDSTFRFFQKRSALSLPSIPFITGDKQLSIYFPRNFAPWTVWIDRDGIVRYITDGGSLSAKNIADFLAGRQPDIPQLQYNGNQLLKKGE